MTGENDNLSQWVQALPTSFFVAPDPATTTHFGQVATWVNAQQRYRPAAKAEFLQVADYYLVAQALQRGDTVVTNEKPEPNNQKRVKIPDVCLGLGIPTINTFSMLRRERARFILQPSR